MVFLNDIQIAQTAPRELMLEKHMKFLTDFYSKQDEFEYIVTEYLRMSGMYWGLTALWLMDGRDKVLEKKDEMLKFIAECYHPNEGGFSAAPNHDAHLLYTLSAVQIVYMLDAMDTLDIDAIERFLLGLMQPDGSFAGDQWGEVDTRFTFCALASLSLMGKPLAASAKRKILNYLERCKNFDGGFGSRESSESHSGQIYCCLGSLYLLDELSLVDRELLSWWLAERQLPSGGLNGRPEKLPDVCYSWWVLASLKMIDAIDYIDRTRLYEFIVACQDDETGGFTDRPGNMPDPFHTLFGLAGLSLLGQSTLQAVNPVFCMPASVVRPQHQRLHIINDA